MNSIEEYLFKDAELFPDRTAIICGGESVSYSELLARVVRRAEELRQFRNHVVPFRTSQSIDFLVEYFAIHLAGAVAAPLEKNMPSDRYEELSSFLSVRSIPEPEIADILFTTGTTGKPKGVMISHGAIVANGENLVESQGFSHDLVFVVCGPLNHIGSLSKVYPVIMQGATLCILEGLKDMDAFFRTFELPYDRFATFLVPASIRMLLRFCSASLMKIADRLEFVETGAAPMYQSDMEELCRFLPHTRLYNTYASTETGIISTFNYNAGECIASCLGTGMKNSGFRICEDSTISCFGKTLMSGYFGDDELSASVMSGNEIHTADFGRCDSRGRLHIIGRKDDIINLGGFKLSPVEIENAALSAPGIIDCICTEVPDIIAGSALKLLVVVEKDFEFSPRKLAAFLKTRLEPYKVPLKYAQVDKIERTFNGKLNRTFYKEI